MSFLDFWNTFGTAAASQSKDSPGPLVAGLPPHRDAEPQPPHFASGQQPNRLGPRLGRPKRRSALVFIRR